jgi:hypothetical protein
MNDERKLRNEIKSLLNSAARTNVAAAEVLSGVRLLRDVTWPEETQPARAEEAYPLGVRADEVRQLARADKAYRLAARADEARQIAAQIVELSVHLQREADFLEAYIHASPERRREMEWEDGKWMPKEEAEQLEKDYEAYCEFVAARRRQP